MRLCYRVWILLPVLAVPLMIASGKGDAAKGKVLYSRCSACHGNSGEGNEAIAKALGVKMPALSSQEIQALDDAALKKVIVEGKGKMQAVKLSDTEVADLIAFVRSLKKAPGK